MAHPLVGKYETTDLTALSPEDRVFARTEIKDALSGKSKAKLSPEDRVILLRLWMETFERAAQPSTASEIANGPAPVAPRAKAPVKTTARRIPSVPIPKFTTIRAIFRALAILRLPDLIFISCCAAVTSAVIYLGAHTMNEAHRIEDVKREAETLVAWIKENGGDKRAEEKFQPVACIKTSGESWKACLASLTSKDGPLADKKNHFDNSYAFFAPKCDMSNPDTVGAIIIEKGAVPIGATSLAYTAFDGTESLAKDLTLRVIVCGRGFHLIRVATDLTF
jgi:hypothetical protein